MSVYLEVEVTVRLPVHLIVFPPAKEGMSQVGHVVVGAWAAAAFLILTVGARFPPGWLHH